MNHNVHFATRRFWINGSIVVVAVMAILAANVGAKKPTPPPPVEVPVHYQIRWLDPLGRGDAMTWDINGAGDVVGYVRDYVETKNGGYYTNYAAFVYVADQDIVIDLNNLITGEAFDTWNVIAAYGINDVGQIAGAVADEATGERRGFVYDSVTEETHLLPPPVDGDGIPFEYSSQIAKKINLQGDVIAQENDNWKTLYAWNAVSGGYYLVSRWQTETYVTDFNDARQILLVDGQRYTPDIGWENFGSEYGISFASGMNNDGMFVGKRVVGDRKTTAYSYRFADGVGGAPDEMLDIMENIRSASDVNSQGDVCITSTYRAYLYTDDTGLWAIDDMVTGNADDVSVWNDTIITYVTHMSDPDETGFGAICGNAIIRGPTIRGQVETWTQAFVLTPTSD